MNEEEMQLRVFGHYDAHLSAGSWKDNILQTLIRMDEHRYMTDKITGMLKENQLNAFDGVRGHPECVFRKRSLLI